MLADSQAVWLIGKFGLILNHAGKRYNSAKTIIIPWVSGTRKWIFALI